MKLKILASRWHILLLIPTVIITGIEVNNNATLVAESRHSRVNGRIVKLYSGTKPEQITCIGEGFQADPVDCSFFYRCIKASSGKYTILRFQCGPGTVYDPDIEVCNHPHSTKRLECRSSRPFQFIIAPVDQIGDNDIEHSVHELPSPMTTKKPLYTEKTSNHEFTSSPIYFPSAKPVLSQNSYYGAFVSANLPETTIKTHISAVTTELPTSITSVVSTTYPLTTSISQHKTTISSSKTEQYDNKCTHDGFMGDSENCRKFFRCVSNQRGGFMKHEFMCSESTIWDDDLQSCNHPWAVRRRRCTHGDSAKDKLSKFHGDILQRNKTINEKNLSNSNIQMTQAPAEISSTLRTPNKLNYGDRINLHKVTVGDLNDVNIGIINSTVKAQTKLPYVEKQTQYMSNYINPLNKTPTQLYESTTKISTHALYHNNEDSSYSTNYANVKEITSACTKSGFMGDPYDCRKFYRCVENGRRKYIKYEFSCAEGTAWDKNIESCNHVWMVKECGSKIVSSSSISDKNELDKMYTTVALNILSDVNELNVGSYNQQSGKEQQVTSKPTTVSLEGAVTPSKSSKLNKGQEICNSTGYMGSEQDCKRFSRCVENGKGGFTKFEYMCGEGTVWDPNIEACNHAWIVKRCGIDFKNETKLITPSTEATIITTISFIKTTIQSSIINDDYDFGYVSSKTTASESTPKIISSTKVLLNTGNKCAENGFMADSFDCHKFYRCVDNGNGGFTRFEYSCGEGTLWDAEISACNHVWAVKKCGNNVPVVSNQNKPSQSPFPVIVEDVENSYTTEVHKDTIRTTDSTTVLNSVIKTTTVGNKLNVCNQSGFIGDETNCKKFYRCVANGDGSYKQYEFSCSEGTVWDPEIEACNHDWVVNKCGGSIDKQHEVTATQSSTSMHTTNDNFDNGYSTQIHNQTAVTVQSIVSSSTYNTPVAEASTTIKTSPANDICSAEGFYGDYRDCKKFYRCVTSQQGKFHKYEFTCGEGTVWDQNIHACNHATRYNNNCSITSATNTTSMNKPPVAIEPSYTESLTTVHLEEHSTERNKDSTHNTGRSCLAEGFYPDSKDCKKFFRCVNNGEGGYIKYDFTCGEGTIWVQAIQACDHNNDNIICGAEILADKETHIMTTTIGTSSDISTTQKEKPIKDKRPTESSNESNISQRNECYSEGYHANSADCRQFYRCVVNDGGTYIKYDYLCGEGTAWDIGAQSCNHISAVKRCHKTNAQETQTISTTQKVEGSQPTEKIRTTKASNLAPESTHINDKPSNEDDCDSDGYFGNNEDCKKFYRCVDNGKGDFVKYDYICGDGTIWDQDILTCNHPKDVSNPSCNQGTKDSTSTTNTVSSIQQTTTVSPSSPSSTTTSMIPETTVLSSESSQSSTTTSMSSENTISSSSENSQTSSNCSNEDNSEKPVNQDITCNKAGYFANPKDCKKFYRCVDWDSNGQKFSVFHFECGEGTIWDPALDTCNYEESVYPPRNCSGSQPQNSNSTSETTTEKVRDSSTSTISSETTTQTTQQTQESTSSPDSTTTQQSPSSETTTMLSTTLGEQTTTQQSSTSVISSSTTPTTTEQTTSDQTTSTTVTSTTTTPTTTEQTTSEQTTTDKMTTASIKTTTTAEMTTTVTEQQTSSTTTDQPTTQMTESSTGQSTTTEETTTLESSTVQQTSTESTTEKQNPSSTTEESTTTNAGSTSEITQETTTEGRPNNNCPDTENDQYLYACPTSFKRHPKYCNLFYQCLEDNNSHELKIAIFNCPNGTIYDESKIQCVEETKAEKKCQGAIARKSRLKRLNSNNKESITVTGSKYGCSGVGHYPFEKNEVCSPALLKCEVSKTGKLRGFVFRCPENYVYWSVSRRCEPISRMSGCKSSPNQWTGRSEIPIERKNIAH